MGFPRRRPHRAAKLHVEHALPRALPGPSTLNLRACAKLDPMSRSPIFALLALFVALASTSATVARGLCAERAACAIRPCCAEGNRPAPIPPTTMRPRMACCEAAPEIPVARVHASLDDLVAHVAPLPAAPPTLIAPTPTLVSPALGAPPAPRPPLYLSKCSLLC